LLKDFTEVTVIAVKKEPKTTNGNDHRTGSIIAHIANITARIRRRRAEKKIEDILGGDQPGFGKGRGTRNAVGMLTIISEGT
jgi:hypothetical protein